MVTKYIPVIPTDNSYKLALAATKKPQPHGEAAVGISERWAREDHVHPGFCTNGDGRRACTFRPGYAGHVTANISNVFFTGLWTGGNGAYRRFDIKPDDIEIADYPNTIYPKSSDRTLFIAGARPEDGRLRENDRPGQVHLWRFTIEYSGLGTGQQYYFIGRLRNPDSGFELNVTQTIFTGSNGSATSGKISFNFETVADDDSLDDGRGYEFGIVAVYNSWPVPSVLSLTRILRTSLAMENKISDDGGGTLKALYLTDDNINDYISHVRYPAEWNRFDGDPVYDLCVPNEYDVVEIDVSEDYKFRGIVPIVGETFEDWKIIKITSPSRSVSFWQGSYVDDSNNPDNVHLDADYRITKYWYNIYRGSRLEEFAAEFILRNKIWYTTFY
jgi:hypothetical protein